MNTNLTRMNAAPLMPIQQQILRRLTLFAIGIGLILAVVIGIWRYADRLANVTHLQSDFLEEASTDIRNTLEEASGIAQRLAAASITETFANYAVNLPDATGLATAQRELFTLFNSALIEPGSLVNRVRFIQPDATVYTDLTRVGGSAIANLRPQVGLLASDQAVQDIIRDLEGVSISKLANAEADTVRFIAPVLDSSGLQINGLVEIQVVLTNLSEELNQFARTLGSEWLLVDNANQVVVGSDVSLFRADLINTLPLDNTFVLYNDGSQTISGQLLRLRPGNTWQLLLLDKDGVFGLDFWGSILGIVMGIVALVGGFLWFLNQTLQARLGALVTATSAAQRLAAGEEAGTFVNATAGSGDELGQLMTAFDHISSRFNHLSAQMERQISRHSRTLTSATKVSRITTTATDAVDLLGRAVDSLVDEFNLYHAQIYLLDDVGLSVQLMHSHGEIGKALLQRSNAVVVDPTTLVGKAITSQRSIAIPDTADPTLKPPYVPNPLLPETRSRLIIPLIVGDQVSGVLDLYDNQVNTFGPEEVRLYELLTDQIALALATLRRLKDAETQIQQKDNLNRQFMRQSWESYKDESGLDNAYDYNLMQVQPTDVNAEPQEGRIEAISAPISIRGEVIGTITAAAPDGLSFAEGDQMILRAVADRVGLSVENARLFKQTQSSLNLTSVLYDLSRTLNESGSLQEVIGAVIRATMPDASSGQIWLFEEASSNQPLQWLSIAAYWPEEGRKSGESNVLGTRLYLPDSPFLQSLTRGQAQVSTNISVDERLDDDLLYFCRSLEMKSAIFVPVIVRGQWKGMMTIGFGQPRTFTRQQLSIFDALIDQSGVTIDNRLLVVQQEATLSQIERLYTSSREINRSRSAVDMVQAMRASIKDERLNIELGLFEGEPDATGWPTRLRTVARSHGKAIIEDDSVTPISIPEDSPLRHREHQTTYNPGAETQVSVSLPLFSANQPIALLSITSRQLIDLKPSDYEIFNALAGQISTVLQNQRLFRAVEVERAYLRSLLETMPVGIIVLDPATFIPRQVNEQANVLFGRPIVMDQPFEIDHYNILRTGTNAPYPPDELPIFTVSQLQTAMFADDISVILPEGGQIDLLLNAAPIFDAQGKLDSILAAFQDISNLRGLENALQGNLRETIALYEATRALSEATNIDGVLDASLVQLSSLEPAQGFIVLLDDETGDFRPARSLDPEDTFNLPGEIFDPEILLYSGQEDNYKLEKEVPEKLSGRNIQAFASVPLRARDTLLGWIVLSYDHPRPFSPEDERFLTTLADSAAVAIDNRNLFVRTEVAYQEAASLYETSRALTNSNSLDDILTAIVNHMRPPHVNQVFMAIPVNENADGQVTAMQVAANWQESEAAAVDLSGIILQPDQFPAWGPLNTAGIMLVDDAETDSRLTEMERIGFMSLNTRSVALLPLRTGNRRIGTVWLGSPEPFRHGERHMRLYRSFVEQASLSMEATRLLDQTERRARQLATSAQVAQIASSILSLDELLPRLVDLIKSAFGYDHVQIFLMDDNDEYAVLRASTGEAGQKLLNLKHKLAKGSRSVIGQVTAHAEPAIALDTSDARYVHKPNPYLPFTRSEMALPLVVKNTVVGALDVQSNQANAFNEEDITVLTTLAAQISVALENARLFTQSESRAKDMSFLYTVTAAAAAAGDSSLLISLQSVSNLVRNFFAALDVTIYLIDRAMDADGLEKVLLRPVALSGTSQPLSEIAEVYLEDEVNLLAQSARTRDSIITGDLSRHAGYVPIASDARSMVAVPLTAGGNIVGIISMESMEMHAFGEQTVSLLRALTSTLSAIVQNARLLEQVQSQNEQLREVDRLKSEFLANMSHELRTPLNSIIGFSRVILKGIDGPLTEMQEQDLSTIYNSGTHLLGLINDILDQAKISSGKMDLHLDYFDMKAVCEGVRSIGIGLVKDKPIDLRLEVASGLPKAFGDEFRTRQVLLNLVSNASKFTQTGHVAIRAYTVEEGDSRRPMLRVDVEDTGIGISEQDMPLLFEAFRQVDSSLTRTVGGTGLGLPIAKSLIEAQGGQMLVTSEVNVGSVFSILIPLGPAPEPTEQVDEQPKPKNDAALAKTALLGALPQSTPSTTSRATIETPVTQLSPTESTEPPAPARKRQTGMLSAPPPRRQILVIEENPDMVDQYRRALGREGFDIFAASIPLEAEAMASGLHPTLIIMDVDFAGGQGWDMLGRLKARGDTHDIPVIVVTLSTEVSRALEAGAFTVIQRPFLPEQLVRTVQDAERDSQTERILIIDDQPESSRLIQQLLDDNGRYRVYTAHSGMEGMMMVAMHRPNLIILDLRMPEMDGFKVLEELQSNPEAASVPVMIVTADTTLNDNERGQLFGLDVVYKTDLSQQNYTDFIKGVKTHLGQM
ncbi:MAG TPA: GAF domain-containing protein [Aggregatilineales bacterium]|nr:GAF domain-containing protein [Aggregatilineales bacterium]